MNFLKLTLKGFLIGIAFIIPGLSGGTLAIYLGVYDKFLESISHIFKDFKNSVKFLLPVFIGIALSVVGLAKLLGILIELNSFVTLFFFIGLILGGIPSLNKEVDWKKKDFAGTIAMFIAFLLVVLLLYFRIQSTAAGVSSFDVTLGNALLILILGFAASATMIVPGISGSALLMVLGYYTAIVTNTVGNLFDFSLISYHLFVVAFFGIGATLGIFVFSKILSWLLKNKRMATYKAIIGFILASVIVIFFEIRDPSTAALFENQTPIYLDFFSYVSTHIFSVLLGLVTVAGGFFASKQMVKLSGE